MRRLLIASLLTLPMAHASAATITVTNLGDIVDPSPGDGVCNVEPENPMPQCTLRAAIQTANALPGHDTIVLEPGAIYQLNLLGDGDADVGDLNVQGELTILGFVDSPPANSADLPLIDAGGLNHRIFRVHQQSSLNLRGLRLQGGNSGNDAGGAIWSEGQLRVEHSELRFNRAFIGGAIASFIEGPHDAELGIEVIDSHLERNDATHLGGAVYGHRTGLDIQRSSFRDNRASAVNGGTIQLLNGANGPATSIISSTFDGTPTAPPIAGLGATRGIQTAVPGEFTLRNVTIGGFGTALQLSGLDASARVRVANSALSGSTLGCDASPLAGEADVVIAYSLVQSELDCAGFYHEVRQGVAPELGAMVNDPGRLTWSQPPAHLFANVVDAGIAPNIAPLSPELACTATDQRGNPRPQDGDGDEIARCDFGAVEEGEPTTYLVDSTGDAVDDVPGDGLCETLSFECTLRAAVMEANALPGIQRIRFAPGIDELELILPPHPAATGGDLDLSEGLIINGNREQGRPATTILQTVLGERLFDLPAVFDGPVILRQLRLKGGNSGAAFGGAIRQSGGQLTVENSELSGNHSPLFGGAIAVHAGSLSLQASDLHGNSADFGGGALFVGAGASASVLASSIWNHADADPVTGVGLAALWVEGNGTLRLSNSTLTQNSAAVLADHPLALLVSHSTIANNSGTGLQGGFGPANQVSILRTIITGNGQGDLAKGGHVATDCIVPTLHLANVLAYDYVLDSDSSCPTGFGAAFTADALLLPLTPLAGQAGRAMPPRFDPDKGMISPALDVAPEAGCLRVDQAGAARPIDLPDLPNIDGPCDLGAIELQSEALFGNGFED